MTAWARMELMRFFLSFLICCAMPAFALADEVVFQIEPSREFQRNSEGSFVTLNSGKILFIYTQFFGGEGDHSAARLVSVETEDQGKTWSQTPKVLLENPGGANVMSVSLLRLKSGRIAFFYLLKNTWLDCRPHVRFSDDEGQTWSEPVRMIEAPGYFVLNNDRVIQLTSGRLIAPLAFHRARVSNPDSHTAFDSRAIGLWVISDDEGKTWKEAPQWLSLPVPTTKSGLQEPGVVELADGGLFAWFRTDQGVQYEARSADQGKTWTPVAAGPMKSPTSPATIERLPGSIDLLGVWNDHSGQFPMVKDKRTPLVVAVSKDGGASWVQPRLIESDPEGWYCYTAIHFTQDAVLLAYCAGDSKVGGLNRLRMRRIPLKELGIP